MNQRYRLKFDGTVSAGNILTAITLIVALVIWGARLEGRVDQNAARVDAIERLSSAQLASFTNEVQRVEMRISNQIDDMRSDLAEIRSVLLRSPGDPRTGNP